MSGPRDVAIVVVAAGSSTRFGADKLSAALGRRTVLAHAIDAVRGPFPAARMALVVRAEQTEAAAREWAGPDTLVVAGGERRQDSVRRGVEALDPADETVVVVHDGARPFVPASDVYAVATAAAEAGAALLVAPLADTVKRVSPTGQVVDTVPREQLARALTPQAFKAAVLRRAWRETDDRLWTDEAAMVESLGATVRAVAGDRRNLKVTTPEDLRMLSPWFQLGARTGQGLDIHPVAPERELWLCGVRVPEGPGLAGHSDADVALHAVTDAILGACGAGDIGLHFPPTDPRWKDASSSLFVRHAVALARRAGFAVSHCDVTLVVERPRIAPYREAMLSRLAELLAVGAGAVNVKATTAEGLGFVGRGEGALALAVVTLEAADPVGPGA